MADITKTEEHTLEHCTSCDSNQLEHLETKSLYVEDIPEVKKEVIHHRIWHVSLRGLWPTTIRSFYSSWSNGHSGTTCECQGVVFELHSALQ